jgi:hypothetical protein
MMDFHNTYVFTMKKMDNSSNLQININHRTRHNSLCRDKNKHWVTSYVTVYEAVSHVTLPLMHELVPAPTLVA